MRCIAAFKRVFAILGLVLALTMGFAGVTGVNQASAQTAIDPAFCMNLFNRGLITSGGLIINPETFEADFAAAVEDFPPLGAFSADEFIDGGCVPGGIPDETGGVGPPNQVNLPGTAQVPANPGPPANLPVELPENAGPPEERGRPETPGRGRR